MTMTVEEYYNWLLSGPRVSEHDLGIHQRLRLGLRGRFLNPTLDDLKFMRSLGLEPLLKLFSIDPSGESKLLILKSLPVETLKASQILDVYRAVNDWLTKANLKDVESFKIQFDGLYQKPLKEGFYRQKPTVNQYYEALQAGFFHGEEELFWNQVTPKINTINELESAWSTHWVPYTKTHSSLFTPSKHYIKRLRPAIITVLNKFFSWHPTEDEFSKLQQIKFTTKFAVFSQWIEDPIVYFSVLAKMISNGMFKLGNTLWLKQKEKILSLGPSLIELKIIFEIDLPIKIQVDLLDYSIEHLSIRRKSEWDIVWSLFSECFSTRHLNDEALDKHKPLFEKAISKYLLSSPNPTDLVATLYEPIFRLEYPRMVYLRLLLLQLGSLDRLKSLQVDAGFWRDIAKVFRSNPALLAQLRVNQEGADFLIANVSEDPIVSYQIYKRYLSWNSGDFEFALNHLKLPLRQEASMDKAFAEPLWEQSFSEFLKTNPSFEDLLNIRMSIVDSKAYKRFLVAALEKCDSLGDLEKIIFQFGDEWKKGLNDKVVQDILNINSLLIPPKFFDLYPKAEKTWNLKMYSEFITQFSMPSAFITIFDQIHRKGIVANRSWPFTDLWIDFPTGEDRNRFQVYRALYLLFERKVLMASKNQWRYDTPSVIMEYLLTEPVVQELVLKDKVNLVLDIYRFYILRTLLESVRENVHKLSPFDLQQMTNQIFQRNIERLPSPFNGKLSVENRRLQAKYTDYIEVKWSELKNVTIYKRDNKSARDYELEMNDELKEAEVAIERDLSQHIRWKVMLEEALTSQHKDYELEKVPGQKSNRFEERSSCRSLLKSE
jgi:hypothetical protein